MFKKMFVAVCIAIIVAVAGCSPKKPTEIKTYRELFDYSISAMKAYKDAPSEYVSLLKDAVAILGDELDENIDKKGEAWTDFADEKEIEGAVFEMYFAIGSLEDAQFEEKYKDVDGEAFADTLEKAFVEYAK